jgi:diadenosine tetraphosphate (Ap4A) HIT family hydrolase
MVSRHNPFSEESQINARVRGEYDQIAGTVNKCVFCDLKDKYILKEKNGLVLTVNIFPYIDGQLLVIPRRHVESFAELTGEEIITNFELTKTAIGILKKELKVEGLWLVLREGVLGEASGKTVSHLHWNIMPYMQGLNTWHYQEITIPPLKLAARLRRKIK